jgi:hypothetical protein
MNPKFPLTAQPLIGMLSPAVNKPPGNDKMTLATSSYT